MIIKKSFLWLFIIFSILFSLFYFKKNLLVNYANFFIVNNAKKGADLILILSGNVLTRAPHAFNLVEDGYSSRIMITKMQWHQLPHNIKYPNDIELANKIKQEYKIKADLEILPSLKPLGASSTFDEAKDFNHFLINNKLSNIILVTDENHTRRALMAFRKIINNDLNINLFVSAAPNGIYNKYNWWQSDIGLKTYILEVFLYIYYFFYDDNIEIDNNI